MPISTPKPQFRRLIAGLALILSLAMCAVAGQLTDSTSAMAETSAQTLEQRMAYIESLGWMVDAAAEECDQVLLPAVFDSSYDGYLAIQSECGFDLKAYAGQTVTRYSYTITNYPTAEEGIKLDLLVYQQRIIGGDVRNTSLDGFMHSLLYPQSSEQL